MINPMGTGNRSTRMARTTLGISSLELRRGLGGFDGLMAVSMLGNSKMATCMAKESSSRAMETSIRGHSSETKSKARGYWRE